MVYTFACKACSAEVMLECRLVDLDPVKEEMKTEVCDCGSTGYVKLLDGFTIGDPVKLGRRQPSAAFQQRLKDIKAKHGASANTGRYGHNITEL